MSLSLFPQIRVNSTRIRSHIISQILRVDDIIIAGEQQQWE